MLTQSAAWTVAETDWLPQLIKITQEADHDTMKAGAARQQNQHKSQLYSEWLR